MKIKLFLAREIQYFELGNFSFNSYVYYLTRTSTALTRAFNLPTRAFSLPARVINLETRAFSVITREFELVTREFELVTRGFELVTRNLLLVFYFSTEYLRQNISKSICHMAHLLKICGNFENH